MQALHQARAHLPQFPFGIQEALAAACGHGATIADTCSLETIVGIRRKMEAAAGSDGDAAAVPAPDAALLSAGVWILRTRLPQPPAGC